MKKLNVAILIFENVELLDFAGPFEVFSVTSELNQHRMFNTFTVSENNKIIKSVNGLKVLPDYNYTNHPFIDVLIIPGGIGSKIEMNNSITLDWVKNVNSMCAYILSICTGARILGKINLLDNIESTTHHENFEELQSIAPLTKINKEVRFTRLGRILTSGGISAGIDLSLFLIETLFGKETKEKTIKYMEYTNH
jgi:transcriptional regulator GlxA family with amidase domain